MADERTGLGCNTVWKSVRPKPLNNNCIFLTTQPFGSIEACWLNRKCSGAFVGDHSIKICCLVLNRSLNKLWLVRIANVLRGGLRNLQCTDDHNSSYWNFCNTSLILLSLAVIFSIRIFMVFESSEIGKNLWVICVMRSVLQAACCNADGKNFNPGL